jgi:hypothetical protein
MKGFIGVTDNDWFVLLSQQQEIDEVIFSSLNHNIQKEPPPFTILESL